MRNRVLILACVLAVGAACNLNGFTADSTAAMVHAASPQINTLEDLDFAEQGIPGALLTMESVWYCSPHNQQILVELAQGYASYGFGFLEDHLERATRADDDAAQEYWRGRTKAAYLRGRMWGFRFMDERLSVNGGAEGRYHAGLTEWQQYLHRFHSADDVPALFWTANAWLSWVQQSLDDPSALLDLPFAVALMERVKALNPHFFNEGVHFFYGLYYASTPAALGGNPQASRQEFETAINATHRHELIYLTMMARTYAVMVQDRALFQSLLQEVLNAGDIYPVDRLTNQVAKRRARRDMAMVDDLFGPAGLRRVVAAPAAGAAPAGGGAASATR